jgi:hypothetical protein
VQIYNRKFSPTNPVTVASYPGETAKFTGDGNINMFYFQNDTGVRVDGLDISNQGDRISGSAAATYGAVGLKIYDSQHIELDHLYVHDNGTSTGGQGTLVSNSEGGGCSTCTFDYDADVQIWNSTFTNNGLVGSSQDHSVYFGGGYTPSGSGNVIANDIVYDQGAGYAVQIGDNADGVLAVNNTIYHTYGYKYGGAFELFNQGGSSETRNVKIYNNLIVDNNNGVVGSGWGSMPSNTVDYNYAFGTLATSSDCAPRCDFNPMYGDSGVQVYTAGSHNLVGADPQFVNAAGHDFHLKAGSPALGTANPAYAPPQDADGNPRPAAPAVGAFD